MIIAKGVYPCPPPKHQGKQKTKYLHPQVLVTLPGERLYPKCEQCVMQVNPTAWNPQEIKTCNRMRAITLQRKVVSDYAKALNV